MLDTIISITYYERLRDLGIKIIPSILANNPLYEYKKNTTNHKLLQFNPNKAFIEKYGYFPCVTVSITPSKYDSGWIVQYLKLQCSIPKTVFENSYVMVDQLDALGFSSKLSEKLKHISIPVEPRQAAGLSLSEAAICYNILLPKRFGRPSGFLKKLSLLDLGKYYRNVKNNDFVEEAYGFCIRDFSTNTGHRIYDEASRIINEPTTMSEVFIGANIKKDMIPSNVLRIEKTYQKKIALRRSIQKYRKEVVKDIFIEDLFDNNFCKSELTNMIETMSDAGDLMAVELGYTPRFVAPITALKQAKPLGLKGKDALAFSFVSLAAGQMGIKNFKVIYDEAFGRKGQKQRSNYKSKIAKTLRAADLGGFFLPELFTEINRQLQDFIIFKNEKEALKLYQEVENMSKNNPTKIDNGTIDIGTLPLFAGL